MNTLLDCGLIRLQKEREERLAGGSVPDLREEQKQQQIESVLKQERKATKQRSAPSFLQPR